MNRDFLGRGWSFPPDFTGPATGVAMLEEDADVASSLQILLSTTPGERVMQPLYGCNMSELVFESLDTRMKTLMQDKIDSAILYFEPRVTLENVTLDDSQILEGVVLISVIYHGQVDQFALQLRLPLLHPGRHRHQSDDDDQPAARQRLSDGRGLLTEHRSIEARARGHEPGRSRIGRA